MNYIINNSSFEELSAYVASVKNILESCELLDVWKGTFKLVAFVKGTQFDLLVEIEFEEHWKDGNIFGWDGKDMENGNISSQESVLDLDSYSTVEELIEVGPEKLKEHTPLDQLDKKHFAKGARASDQNGAANPEKINNTKKEISLMEAKLQRMCELLKETITQTKDNVEKKQALTYEEMEAEREETR